MGRSRSAPLLGFGSLQHMRDRRSTHAGTPTRYVPPSGFGYPPGGLLPSIPCRFSFAPAALLGFTLRSVPLSKGIRGVTTRMSPHTVSPIGAPDAVALGRPHRLQFLGFNPFESPSRPVKGLARRPPDAPLGFFPSRVLHRRPCPGFHPGSSLALPVPGTRPDPSAPQSLHRPSAGPLRCAAASCVGRIGRPF
jgi:hypothetical protein